MSRPTRGAWEEQATGAMAFVVYRRGVEVARVAEGAVIDDPGVFFPAYYRHDRAKGQLARVVRRLDRRRQRAPGGPHRRRRPPRHLGRLGRCDAYATTGPVFISVDPAAPGRDRSTAVAFAQLPNGRVQYLGEVTDLKVERRVPALPGALEVVDVE